jgi:hypothetical protein
MTQRTVKSVKTSYNDIVIGGLPATYDGATGQVEVNGTPVSGELIVELGNRIRAALVRDGYIHAPEGALSYVGGRMSSLEIDHAACELKFKGVEVWLGDHFSNDEKLAEAKQILSEAKERINVL